MNRRHFTSLLLASASLSGCGLFDEKKQPLIGERISVLALDRRLEPDPALAKTPLTLPPAVLNPDWPQSGGEPAHVMGQLSLGGDLRLAWKLSLGEGSSRYTRVLASPIVAKGRVYAMDGGAQVTACDASNGAVAWRVDLKPEGERGSAFGGGIAFWNGRLYIATGYAQAFALDPDTGKTEWKQTVPAPIRSAPTVAAGRVFLVTVDNELDVLSTDDGHKLWTHNGIPETAGLLGGASPAIEGDVALVAYSSGELFALRADNGRALWSDNLAATRRFDAVSALADIRGRPVVDRGRVFAVSHSGRLASMDLRSGDRVWEQEIGSSNSPWLAGDYLFVLSNESELICLARSDGKIRWVRQLPRYADEKAKEDPIRWAGPALGSERLIVLSSLGEALLVSPYSGETIGREPVSAAGFVGPIIADNTLYVLTDDATLAAYR